MATVEESIAAVREAAKTPRARMILDMLDAEMKAGGRDRPKTSDENAPVFPSKETVAQLMRDKSSARGDHSPDEGQGSATARKEGS